MHNYKCCRTINVVEVNPENKYHQPPQNLKTESAQTLIYPVDLAYYQDLNNRHS